ncbi:hypothetical protein AURDEDRAFT_131684 [Auricularia subglabra TFB-10046 SS5]|uniref:Uncharacterized protein n=1 Tax=Auricularia subglabra (strain TFB-10046 / SS5) TaxID=717982 RepID=J0WNL0_AURST|nr:hypothetical protein AURDEDRAFT_131684 [Auricularia subglabra TFB-10046 SS5]
MHPWDAYVISRLLGLWGSHWAKMPARLASRSPGHSITHILLSVTGSQHLHPSRDPSALSLSQLKYNSLLSMVFCLPRYIFSRHRRCTYDPFSALPKGWRFAGGHDIFADFCNEYIKADLLLWSRLVLPESAHISQRLAVFGDGWDLMDHDGRLEAQNLLKEVKAGYVMDITLKGLEN